MFLSKYGNIQFTDSGNLSPADLKVVIDKVVDYEKKDREREEKRQKGFLQALGKAIGVAKIGRL